MVKSALDAFNEVTGHKEFGIAGDWHGQTGWAKHVLRLIAQTTSSPAIFQLGDFGFWPDNSGRKYLHRINKELVSLDKFLFITLGNHEDYNQVSRMQPVQGVKGFRHNPDFPRIITLERGFRWEWLGRSFISVGGANSIDRKSRTEGLSWWPGEQISTQDVSNAVQGGKTDIMFSHDIPSGIRLPLDSHNSSNWPLEAVTYANGSREQLRRITDVVQPRVLFHGHYHMDSVAITELGVLGTGDSYTIESRCLNKDYTPENIGVFRIEDESFERIHTLKPDWKFPHKSDEVSWFGGSKASA